MPPTRNLDHNSDVRVKRRPRATGSVQSLGTTAKGAPRNANPAWWADLEYVWRMRTHDELQRLDARARQRRRVSLEHVRDGKLGQAVIASRSAEWAEHRAQSMALPRREVIGACGKRWRRVVCGCGQVDVPVGCDQVALCSVCSRVHWRRWRRKITRAMDAHVRAARASWARSPSRTGMLPGVYLITLTIPHSGSIIEDRAELGRAWRELTKRANAGRWWGAYALAYEVTPGTVEDGLRGHVHAHVACVSSWVPYEELHAAWRSIAGAVVLDVSAPRRGSGGASAANYLAKYVTKGVDPGVFTGQKAGELLVAMRGKRRVTASRGFWVPIRDRESRCPTCGKPHRACGSPPSMRAIAPGAVLQAMAERIGWWVPRGAVQCTLAT